MLHLRSFAAFPGSSAANCISSRASTSLQRSARGLHALSSLLSAPEQGRDQEPPEPPVTGAGGDRTAQEADAVDGGSRAPRGRQQVARPSFSFDAETAVDLSVPVDAAQATERRPAAGSAQPGSKKKPGVKLHEFLQPARIPDLAEEFRPHFRVVTRTRPTVRSISDVWNDLRAADKMSARAAANNFIPSVDCSISLLVDPKRSDHIVRGMASMPHGTGRDLRVLVFATESDAEAALQAGAATVGAEELIAKIAEEKSVQADAVVATPQMVPKLGKVARILGPRGLMPNPKYGTVTTDVAATVAELRKGKVQFRSDKGGVVSSSIGRKTYSDDELTANLQALFTAVMLLRPKTLSGAGMQGYVERVTLSTTQGKGFPVALSDMKSLIQGSV